MYLIMTIHFDGATIKLSAIATEHRLAEANTYALEV